LKVAAVDLLDVCLVAEAVLDTTQQIGDVSNEGAHHIAIAINEVDHDRWPGIQHNLQNIADIEVVGRRLGRSDRSLESQLVTRGAVVTGAKAPTGPATSASAAHFASICMIKIKY
jgi:hypothetical protein